jgi:PTS system nitrogen regulatory IIA component
MKIIDFLRPELIAPNLQGKDKREVLGELADHMAGYLPDPPGKYDPAQRRDQLLGVLLDRERLASTAIGEGVAIPHGKLRDLGRLSACLGRSPGGVAFDSIDGRPTHIFFVLVAPEHSTGEHLKALARISRLFKDPEFRARLMEAKTAADIYRVVADEDAKY